MKDAHGTKVTAAEAAEVMDALRAAASWVFIADRG
jgi:hypothetical protein